MKRKRRNWSKRQKKKLLKEFRESGLSKSAYAKLIDVHLNTLNNWIKKIGLPKVENEASKVIPVKIKEEPVLKSESKTSHFEIQLSGIGSIQVPTDFCEDSLIRLIKTLKRC